MQAHDGKLHPVSNKNKKLSSTERNCSTVEKECLAIILGVRKYKLYLQGVPFVLQTKNSHIMRGALFLQNIDMILKPVRGSDNLGADYKSRSI